MYKKKPEKTGLKLKCSFCGRKVYKQKSQIKSSKSGRIFCDRSCSTSYNNSKYKSRENNPNYLGCVSPSCYRKLLFETRKHECEKCGYNKIPEILHVHHIDRNRDNNCEENLLLLCPTCHEEEHFLTQTAKWGQNK